MHEDDVDKEALESSLNTIDIWLIAFGIFVAIGVVGESIAGFLHWRRSGQLQALQTVQNLFLTQSITEMQRQNLALQKEIIAAEHALADRFIWYDQRPAFQAALSKYPGMTARLWMYPASSPDTLTLGMTIVGLMMGAKWQATLWDLHTASPVPGVQVLYREGDANAKEAADALVAGLRSAKIEFVGDPVGMKANEPAATPPPPATVTFATNKEIPAEEAIRVFIGGKANPFR